MTKDELRLRYKDARKAFVIHTENSERNRLQDTLCKRLESADILTGFLGGYAAMTSEIDPLPTLKSQHDMGRQIALPHFSERGPDMQFRAWDGGPLETGPFGFGQPADDAPFLSPDCFLVPLVAVDKNGNRLGLGHGHFDRFIATQREIKPIRTIGLAWECQIADAIPADPWDQKLDYVATPERLIQVTS